MQLTNKLTQLDTREDSLFALIGHPEWDTKLNQHMRNLRTEKSDTQRQLADMNTALETGRGLFLTGLAMLADPRQVYDNGPDEIKTTRHPTTGYRQPQRPPNTLQPYPQS